MLSVVRGSRVSLLGSASSSEATLVDVAAWTWARRSSSKIEEAERSPAMSSGRGCLGAEDGMVGFSRRNFSRTGLGRVDGAGGLSSSAARRGEMIKERV